MNTQQQPAPPTYLVTGASSGIGLSVAQGLLQQGNVVAVCRRKPDIAPMQTDTNPDNHGALFHHSCDLGDAAALESTIRPILKQHNLQAAVLCHGFGDFACIEEFSSARIVSMIGVNLTSYLLLCRLLMPLFKRRKQGDLVIIGSESGLQAGKSGAVYSATKFGLQGLVAALRAECAASGVRVSIVNPGLVNTGFFDELDFQPGDDRNNYLEAQDVAAAVSHILSLPRGSVIDTINLSPQKKVIKHKNQQAPLKAVGKR